MDYATAVDIFTRFGSTKQTDLKADLIEAAVRYAQIRVEWLLADPERRRHIDEDRTRAHNAFIATCDILGRNMDQHGEDGSWRADLGTDRKRIGDFACHLHCMLGIAAR
jgi:hypothetical protein